MTAARHTSADFLTFLERVVATQPPHREIHLIVDNLSARKTKAVQTWLAAHPRIRLHFTSTYSSWLKLAEHVSHTAPSLGSDDVLAPILVGQFQTAPCGFGEDVYPPFRRVVGQEEP